MEGDLLLVPSGAIAMVLCSLMAALAVVLRVEMAELRFSRSMGICPILFMAAPKIGILNKLFLATKCGKYGKVESVNVKRLGGQERYDWIITDKQGV